MNHSKKSKKLLIVATTLMVIALASVLTVYAAVVIGTINGGAVTVGGVTTGTITYSTTGADGTGPWTPTLDSGTGSWHTKLALDGGYVGPVTISWQLQSYATGSWEPVGTPAVSTSITLTGSAGQIVYATTTGVITASNNHDWHLEATAGGTYRVVAQISSVSS
jgi:hypothetical protein